MAVVQRTYATGITVGVPGKVATGLKDDGVETRRCEEASIEFGLAVSEGTGPHGCKFAATGLIGITIIDPSLLTRQGQIQDRYLREFNAAILLEGDVWVTVASNVVRGQQASFHPVDGKIDVAGADDGTLPAPNVYPLIAHSRFETSALAGGIALLRLVAKQEAPTAEEQSEYTAKAIHIDQGVQ